MPLNEALQALLGGRPVIAIQKAVAAFPIFTIYKFHVVISDGAILISTTSSPLISPPSGSIVGMSSPSSL